MIKKLIVLLTVPMVLLSFIDDSKYVGLSKDEVKFVKNIERMEAEELSKVYKTLDGKVMVEFGSVKYLLNTSTGFVDNMWILGDDDITWEELGPEY
jgi:hypothetical protein